MRELFFWASFGLLLYAHGIYPAGLVLAARLRPRHNRARPITPSVSVIIAACNERDAIVGKLENTLALDYPEDRLEIIVATDDGGVDGTKEAASRFADRGVVLCHTSGARGKNRSMDAAVEKAHGEILLFTDATGELNSEAVRRMVAHFADPEIGCVGGFVAFRDRDDLAVRGHEVYKGVEETLRHASQALGYVPSVAGTLHAMRRELYDRVENHLTRDLVDPAQVVARGYRVVLENGAVSRELPWEGLADTWRGRVRVTQRCFAAAPYILRRFREAGCRVAAVQFVSHKLLRWLTGILALVLALSSASLSSRSPLYAAIALAAGLGLLAGAAGLLAERRGAPVRWLRPPAFFLLSLAAMTAGALRTFAGQSAATWRDEPPGAPAEAAKA